MPLKESIAAGMLKAAGWWDGVIDLAGARPRVLLDPFCGSGTIPIEAALVALGMPPHALSRRTFALQQWPSFERSIWASVAGECAERMAAADARRCLKRLPGLKLRAMADPSTGRARARPRTPAAARKRARGNVHAQP